MSVAHPNRLTLALASSVGLCCVAQPPPSPVQTPVVNKEDGAFEGFEPEVPDEPEPERDDTQIELVFDDDGWASRAYTYRAPERPESRRIEYAPMPGETLEGVARRFAVDPADIISANDLDPNAPKLTFGQSIEVFANRFPAPRFYFRYRARADESWEDVAQGFGLETETLKEFNRGRPRRLSKGRRIKVWVDSAIPTYAERKEQEPDLEFPIPKWGVSLGGVKWGRLKNGVQLPDSPLYTKRLPKTTWGSTHAVTVVMRSIAIFRHETGFSGEILIGSISRRHGGKFPPHRSHRSGRDVDVGLPAFPGFPAGTRARAGRVDWGATWALMKSFVRSGQVRYIFLTYHMQRRLHDAAKQMGATDEELAEIIQWPRSRNSNAGVVRHAKGHDTHFHVRINCGPSEPRCRDPQPTTLLANSASQ